VQAEKLTFLGKDDLLDDPLVLEPGQEHANVLLQVDHILDKVLAALLCFFFFFLFCNGFSVKKNTFEKSIYLPACSRRCYA